MSFVSRTRIVAESSGDLIEELPFLASTPSINEEIALSTDGGAQTVYKVEKVQHIVSIGTHNSPNTPTKHSVDGTIEITVSVVP